MPLSPLSNKFNPAVGTQNESNRSGWLEATLQQIPPGSRILDAGAGEQQFRKFCTHLQYVSQDFGQYDGQGDQKGLQVGKWSKNNLDIISDITNIPEPDQAFDVILCTEVLEHLPDPLAALREFSRLLKPNGYLIITAPFCSLTHFSPYHFNTGFNRYFYETHLPKYGFTIVELQTNGNFFEYLAQEVRRIPTVTEKYTQTSLKKWEKLVLKLALTILNRLSQNDQSSDELLCFGYHVLAMRN